MMKFPGKETWVNFGISNVGHIWLCRYIPSYAILPRYVYCFYDTEEVLCSLILLSTT